MSDVPMKRCTGPCGQEYPATTQFWHSDKTRPSGLHSQCKKCRADRKKNPPIMLPAVSEGYKRCTKCKKVYPTTTEYWYRTKKSKDGLQSNCKICTDAYYKEYQARPNVKEHRREQAKEYASRPEVKQHKREYGKGYHEQQSKRPEVKQRKKEYMKEYYSRPEVQQHKKEYNHQRYHMPGVKHRKIERQKERLTHPEIRQRHYERMREYYRRPEVKERYKSQTKERNRNRRARKHSVKGTHTPQQIKEQLERQKHRCYYAACGHAKFKKVKGRYIYHIEHTYPLSRVAGTDIPANSADYIVLACPSCNFSKHDKFPWEWPEGGRLF